MWTTIIILNISFSLIKLKFLRQPPLIDHTLLGKTLKLKTSQQFKSQRWLQNQSILETHYPPYSFSQAFNMLIQFYEYKIPWKPTIHVLRPFEKSGALKCLLLFESWILKWFDIDDYSNIEGIP